MKVLKEQGALQYHNEPKPQSARFSEASDVDREAMPDVDSQHLQLPLMAVGAASHHCRQQKAARGSPKSLQELHFSVLLNQNFPKRALIPSLIDHHRQRIYTT